VTGFIVAVCAVLGLAVGSFLNVVIYRVPRKESVVSPRSRCPRCGTEITAFDNIPVLSWLLLRGRCRTCREPISMRYPLIEVACAALFAAMALRFGADWALPAFLTLAAALLAGSAIDIEHQLLPDRLVFPSLALGLIGAVIASGGLLGMALAWPRAGAMGGGDIKLALLLGLCLGWLGLGHVALGLFLGFLFGSIVGVALVVTKAKALQEHFAFGPFLAAGTLVAVWWGTPLLDLYLHR
jgi:leader peptidase (prepilin peptidase)/N-methyltransferase